MKRPSDSPVVFSHWLQHHNKHLQALSPSELVDVMLAFYSEVRCIAIEDEPGSDMLLFQWGVYDWGKGANFEFDLTRQFSNSRGADAGLSQFRVTAYFEPTQALRDIAPGNRWCESSREVADLRAFVLSSKALLAVAGAKAARIEATWSAV